MKSKSEVKLLFQKFLNMIQNQYNAQIQVLRNDNGGEYQSIDFPQYLEIHGIIHQTSCPNTPQQKWGCRAKKLSLIGGCSSFINTS